MIYFSANFFPKENILSIREELFNMGVLCIFRFEYTILSESIVMIAF